MKLDPEALATIADPNAAIEDIVVALELITGRRPWIRRDITDPPSLPRAELGPISVEGEDDDAAIRALGQSLASAIAERRRLELAREAKELADRAEAERVEAAARAEREARRLEREREAQAAAEAVEAERKALRDRVAKLEMQVKALIAKVGA